MKVPAVLSVGVKASIWGGGGLACYFLGRGKWLVYLPFVDVDCVPGLFSVVC